MKCVSVFMAAVFLIISLLCNNAFAEIEAGTFSTGPSVSWYIFDDDQAINNGPVYGLSFGYNYTGNIGVEGTFNYVQADATPSDDNVHLYIYRIDGLYHFIPESIKIFIKVDLPAPFFPTKP